MFLFNKNKQPENLDQLLKAFSLLQEKTQELSRELKELKEKQKFCFQKIGIVRFNPFHDNGGNFSFAIALLDDNNNGVIVTSLYNKESCRVFSKPIINGKSEFALSEEEISAIKQACQKNPTT